MSKPPVLWAWLLLLPWSLPLVSSSIVLGNTISHILPQLEAPGLGMLPNTMDVLSHGQELAWCD